MGQFAKAACAKWREDQAVAVGHTIEQLHG
jgi:hypothetical protein